MFSSTLSYLVLVSFCLVCLLTKDVAFYSIRGSTTLSGLAMATDDYEDDAEIEWADSDTLSYLWSVISEYDLNKIAALLEQDPGIALSRSSDGRGPLFWAYEFGFTETIQLLESLGADNLAEDAKGITPVSLGEANKEINKQRREAAIRAKAEAAAYEQQFNNDDTEILEDEYDEDEYDEDEL